MGEKSLPCYAGFLEKSYFAEEQKHRFLGKFAKLLDKVVKCQNKWGKRLIFKKKCIILGGFCPKNM